MRCTEFLQDERIKSCNEESLAKPGFLITNYSRFIFLSRALLLIQSQRLAPWLFGRQYYCLQVYRK